MSVIRIRQGPSFGRGSGFALLGTILFVVLFIASMFTGSGFEMTTLFFLLFFACLSYLLDFEGVEIDPTNGLVRYYKTKFWFRKGQWRSVDDFDLVSLKIDRFDTIAHNTIDHLRQKRHTFDIVLVGKVIGENLLLEECMSYKQGKVKLKLYAKHLKLPTKDFFKEELQYAKSTRRR